MSTNGWKLVPVEPTPEMAKAWMSGPMMDSIGLTWKSCYARMLAAAPPAPAAGGGEVVAFDDCRISLVTALHFLASDFENALYKFDGDDEARRAANGSIAHARKVAARWNWNGATPTSAPPAEPAAAPGVVAVATVSHLFEPMAGLDKNQPGYEWRKGWNAALRRVLDCAALAAASAPRVAVKLTEKQHIDLVAKYGNWSNHVEQVRLSQQAERASWEANGLKEPT